MNKFIINLYRFSISNAKHIFFQNEEDLTSFLKMKLAKKIQSSVLPGSGVDIQFFRNSNTKIFHKEKNTFLMVTRLLRSKGVCDFLDVAKEFNDKGIPGKFLLVGREELSHPDGILQEEIKNKYTLSNTEFVWNERNVKKFYEFSHYCVFPTRYNEGTPKTLLEASAMGCIPVCYRNKGFKEFIRDKVNGFYSLENKESLFKKMNEIILMDSDELQNISSEAKKTVKLKFNDDLVIDKYNELLD